MSEQNESTPAPAAENATETKEVKENGAGDAAAATAAAEPVAEAEAPKEMRAVVLTSFGGLKSVKTLKKPEPTVGEGEVLIRVKAW